MALPNKSPLQWIYNSNTKGPWSETRGPMIGGPGPWSCGSTVAIRHSNPCYQSIDLDKPSNPNWAQATPVIGRRCVVLCQRPLAPCLYVRYWARAVIHSNCSEGLLWAHFDQHCNRNQRRRLVSGPGSTFMALMFINHCLGLLCWFWPTENELLAMVTRLTVVCG